MYQYDDHDQSFVEARAREFREFDRQDVLRLSRLRDDEGEGAVVAGAHV